MKIMYIIIPGLHDTAFGARIFYRFVTGYWRLTGMRTKLWQPRWGSETYETLYKRLAASVSKNSGPMVLVGVSAGASIAIRLYSDFREVASVVTVSGLLALARHERATTPWLIAARSCQQRARSFTREQKARILTFSPEHDRRIAPERQRLLGADNLPAPGGGHIRSIVLTLLLRRKAIQKFGQAAAHAWSNLG